jgi:anti-sigma factor RsiW
MNPENHLAQHQRFEDLCMLSATGELTPGEEQELERHAETCSRCKQTLAECQEFTIGGMAYLASELAAAGDGEELAWSAEEGQRELFRRIAATRNERPESESTARPVVWRFPRTKWMGWAAVAGLAAALLLVVGYQTGQKQGRHEAVGAVAENQSLLKRLESLTVEKGTVEHRLEAEARNVTDLTTKMQQQATDFAKLKELDKAQQAHGEMLAAENQRQSSIMSSVSAERDGFAQKLQEAEVSLRNTEAELTSVRAQRQRDLLHTASLETEIRTLSTRLKESDSTVNEQQTLLASDRDIRELMGARNLYIADVFDVDGNGTNKPYGRVFYTKNKSLLFYAFDLDQQPHLRNASIFQAWGRRGVSDKMPLNMGIFYLDNEVNKRWILKFDDPDKLAQVDAVFVTLEPHGGSKKPSGKQLLFASIKSMTNHP